VTFSPCLVVTVFFAATFPAKEAVMTNTESRRTAAGDAAAGLAAALLIARCRHGAEQASTPQGRWLAAASQGLIDWLHEGGFASVDEASATDVTKTAAQGRRAYENYARKSAKIASRNGNSLGTATRSGSSLRA
jgi:hypothetical protein